MPRDLFFLAINYTSENTPLLFDSAPALHFNSLMTIAPYHIETSQQLTGFSIMGNTGR